MLQIYPYCRYEENNQIHLDAILTETVPTTVGHSYKFSFEAAPQTQTSTTNAQAVGYVLLPGSHQHFVVHTQQNSDVFPSLNTIWQKQVFYMTATESESEIVIVAEGRGNSMSIRGMSLVELQQGERPVHPDPNHPHADHVQPVHVHISSIGDLTSVTANWDVVDTESPVVNNLWAIGSVKGFIANHIIIFLLTDYNNMRMSLFESKWYQCRKLHFIN